jgi:hypothetical protein
MNKTAAALAWVVLFSLAVNVSAVSVSWDNGNGNNLWSDPINWSGNVLPTISDTVNIALASGPIINAPTAAAGTEIRVGMSGGTAPLTMNGGTLSSGNWLMIGIDTSGKAGTFTMNGGTISLGVTSSVDGHLWLGYKSTGTFTMNGGTVNVPGKFGLSFSGGTANAYLNGGTITTHDFSMTSSSRIDITNGKLIMDGNQTATVNGYISSGWITGYGLASNVRYDYNITTLNKTTVWAVGSNKAANPSPANGASNVAKTTTLSWTAGPGAVSHDVYFGTSNPPAFQNNQTATTFDPGVLDFNTTYYWCIDEVNGPNTVTGDLWMFTTASGLAKNPDPANGATNVAFDKVLYWAAGPDAASHDVYFGTILNDVNSTERLLGDINGDGIVDFNDVSLLTQYWLANPAGSEPYAGVNDDDIVDFIDYALLSQDWMNTAGPVFKGNQDANSFAPGTLALNTTYYWRIDEVNGPDTIRGNIWSFTTQSGKAFNPSPANGASGVAVNPTLSWTAGAGAASHDVYFGTTSPGTFRVNQAGTTYIPPGPLANSTTYYWRIDEVGGSGTVQGDVWNFTTVGTVTVNMRKGPYLIYPGINTQMTVLWQVDVNAGCSLAWGTDTSYSTGSTATAEYGTDHQHKYNITGLTPGTKYYYRLTAGSNVLTGSFNAAPAADANNVKFFMYGDTRTYGASNNSICARMIATYTVDPAYQTMVLHAGDWVNADLETTWTSEWYNYSWTSLMTAPANMPFMGTIGNHESASCPVFEKYRPFPFYAAPADYFSFDYGPVHVAVVDQYTTYTSGSAQYNWLVNDVNTSTKPWKIIVLHQPGWCAGGTHGNDGTVQTVIQPLCLTYGVQIVLAGHNHYYSRAVVPSTPPNVQHITSGAGGAPFYTASPGQPYVVTYTVDTLEFVKVDIQGNTLTFTAVSDGGTVIDGPITLTH